MDYDEYITEPQDRLTRMADRALDTLKEDPEYRKGDRVILLLDDKKFGGIGMYGQADSDEALADLLTHVNALFRASGKKLMITPVGRG